MPVFLEPDVSFPVWLDSDESKPMESRPVFLAKSQSMRGQRKITACLDRITTDDKLTVDDLFSEAVDMLCSVLVGWKNMGEHKFSKETIEEILTYSEAREILRKIAYNQHVTTDQKKDSASQP